MKKLITILCFIGLQVISQPVMSSEYSGKPISLSFTNAETSKVLNIISQFSGKGLVLSDSDLGKITLHVKKIPWDEALKAISISENFDYEVTERLIIISKNECK